MACSPKPLNGGGCAYRGARMALEPITDAAHLVHGPATCPGFSWAMRPTASSASRLHRIGFSTDLGELEVIRGGADKLARAIDAIVRSRDPAGIFVYQTCVPAMTGDDVTGMCQAMAARHGRPVIPVDLPGFAGDRDFGSRAAGDVLLNHLIGTREPEAATATDIAVIGEANVAGEMAQIRPLLAELGIRVAASIPGDGRVAEIAAAHRAKAVLSVCSQSLGGLAAKMRERHGLPTMQASFYGMGNTARALRDVAGLLARTDGPSDLPRRAEALIRERETDALARLRPLLTALAGKRALLLTGGVKTWSLTTALQELGMDVVATTVQKTSAEERHCAATLLGAGRLWDGVSEQRLAAARDVDVVLSGDGFRATALRMGLPWVEINHDRPMALCGYDGLINLARRIHTALRHPIRLGTPRWRQEGAA